MQDIDSGQHFALKVFKKGATTCRDVTYFIANIELGDRGQGIASAGDREASRLGNRFGYRFSAVRKGIKLKHAQRTIPQDRTGVFQDIGQLCRGVGTNIENQVVGGDIVCIFCRGRSGS